MAVIVGFRDEGPLGELLAEGSLSIETDEFDVEVVLRSRVAADLAGLADAVPSPCLVQPMDVSETEDEIVLATPASPDAGGLLAVAREAVAAGLLRVSLETADGGDGARLGPADVIVFEKSAPLIGP